MTGSETLALITHDMKSFFLNDHCTTYFFDCLSLTRLSFPGIVDGSSADLKSNSKRKQTKKIKIPFFDPGANVDASNCCKTFNTDS